MVKELKSYSDQILVFCGEDSSSFSCSFISIYIISLFLIKIK